MESNTTAVSGFNVTTEKPVADPLESRVKVLEAKIKLHEEYFGKIKELTKLLDDVTAERLHS